MKSSYEILTDILDILKWYSHSPLLRQRLREYFEETLSIKKQDYEEYGDFFDRVYKLISGKYLHWREKLLAEELLKIELSEDAIREIFTVNINE